MAAKRNKIQLSQEELNNMETRMYGMTVKEMQKFYVESPTFKELGAGFLALSLLSDVQEMIERNLQEDARQAINRVKWLISVYLIDANAIC